MVQEWRKALIRNRWIITQTQKNSLRQQMEQTEVSNKVTVYNLQSSYSSCRRSAERIWFWLHNMQRDTRITDLFAAVTDTLTFQTDLSESIRSLAVGTGKSNETQVSSISLLVNNVYTYLR